MLIFKWLSPLLDADGDIGAASDQGAASLESPSVAAGTEVSVDGSAPSTASGDGGTTTPDVTQQESFAARLKAEREKIEQEHQPYKKHATRVEQIAKAAGFTDVDSYLEAVDAQLKDRQAAAEAERLGVDQDTYKQFFAPVHTELSQTKQELARLQQSDLERQIKADYDRLSTQYPDFKEHEDKVWALATERRLPLEDAYKLVSYDSRIAAARLETEQQVLANVTGRDNKQVLSSNDQATNTALDPASMSLSDIESLSARVQRGERITL